MRVINIPSRQEIDLKQYTVRSALETDYAELITEPFLLYEGGKLMIAYVYVEESLDELWAALNRIRYGTGARTAGLKTTSRVFGFLPRNTIRRDYCTATSLSYDQPGEHKIVMDAGMIVGRYYQALNPELFDDHRQQTDEVEDDYHIDESVFTSGIINKNNPLKYHFDRGNFPNVWSGMLVHKKDIQGGYLSLPEFNVGVELVNNSLLMFDGQGILHGVTPIIKTSPEATRYSIVYYSMRDMWGCEPLTEELLRIRKLRTEREQADRAVRMAERMGPK